MSIASLIVIRLFIVGYCVSTGAILASGQYSVATAPNKWETYRLSGHDLSVSLPKMPVATVEFDACSETETGRYGVYSQDAAYSLLIHRKKKATSKRFCSETSSFDIGDADRRIKELTASGLPVAQGAVELKKKMVAGLPATIFTALTTDYWILTDAANDRWFEFSVLRRKETQTSGAKIIESLSKSKPGIGIEVGEGSLVTLGDAEMPGIQVPEPGTDTGTLPTWSLALAYKPRARYTEAARQTSLQGTVRLKVTLLSNGSVGAITKVAELPYGLTEQAIYAARRIMFLPKKVQGVNQSVLLTVEYSFSIY